MFFFASSSLVWNVLASKDVGKASLRSRGLSPSCLPRRWTLTGFDEMPISVQRLLTSAVSFCESLKLLRMTSFFRFSSCNTDFTDDLTISENDCLVGVLVTFEVASALGFVADC